MNPLVARRHNFGDRAPIVEALIDLQVTLPDTVALDQLRSFNETLVDEYPHVKTQTEWSNELHVSPDSGTSVTQRHGVRGFLFENTGRDRIVQARRDGFTFSKLKPYDSWQQLCDEAKRLWGRYQEVAKPTLVRRAALRYINHFAFAKDEPVQLDEWFRLHHSSPKDLGPVSDFLIRLAIPHRERPENVAIVTLASQSAQVPALVLDIDVWTRRDLEPGSDELWEVFEELRVYKNDVFFGTITEKLEERLK